MNKVKNINKEDIFWRYIIYENKIGSMEIKHKVNESFKIFTMIIFLSDCLTFLFILMI
jgi:hypothetical protein